MDISKRHGFIFIVLALLLSACATTPSFQPSTKVTKRWQDRRGQLQAIHHWNARGAVAIRHNNDRFSANFAWQQCGGAYQLNLFGPFGSNNTQLRGDNQQVVLLTSDNRRFIADDPERLLAQQLGLRLPINNLYYWIRSVDVPHQPTQMFFDPLDRLSMLEQQGWQIRYLSYGRQRNIDLPTQIFLVRDSLQVRVVIHEWDLSACTL